MVVKNEETLLGQCLKDIGLVADEIIIVDTGSTDNTINIAKKYGARIIRYKWDGSLGKARNAYIKNATGKWILVLDADERIAKKDLFKLKKLTKDSDIIGYIFSRRDYTKTYDLLREWHPNNGAYPDEEKFSGCPGWSLTEYVRLFQRERGVSYDERYPAHADFLESLKRFKRKIRSCEVVIHHYQYLKGEAFVLKKQKERLKNMIKCLKNLPNDPWIYLNIGITLFSLKKDNEAIIYLKKATEIDPGFEMACFVLGMVYKEKADYEKAVLHLKKAISIKPQYADAWAVLGMVYDVQDKPAEAERALKKAIKIHPSHPLAHNSLGIVYQGQERFIKARREYEKAIQIHPQHPDAHHNLRFLLKNHFNIRKQ
jgi:glycosyltransferase involved in cell wall biosynthesis